MLEQLPFRLGVAVAPAARALFLSGLAVLLLAGDASAWFSHQLNAMARVAGDSSTDPNDPYVEALDQAGVPGVDDGSHFFHAEANSDSGVLLAESSVIVGSFPAASSGTTIASIEQWLHVEEIGNPITVQLSLDTNLSAGRTGTASASAAARVDIGTLCNVYVEVYADGDPDVIDGCTDEFGGGNLVFVASAGPGAIHVEATWQPDYLPSNGDIDIHAQVENELQTFAFGATGQALASGALSITVAGAGSHSFTSPTFLTVPEAGDAALAATALAALAARARRRGRRASS